MQIKLLDLHSKPNETADTIAAYVSQSPTKLGLLFKYVASGADNYNTMFGGVRTGGKKNAFVNLKNFNPALMGIGCPAHLLSDCIQHGTDALEVGTESTVLKTYKCFSAYTVHLGRLKEFCDFSKVTYRQLSYQRKHIGYHCFQL
jgi:hypothetical protein